MLKVGDEGPFALNAPERFTSQTRLRQSAVPGRWPEVTVFAQRFDASAIISSVNRQRLTLVCKKAGVKLRNRTPKTESNLSPASCIHGRRPRSMERHLQRRHFVTTRPPLTRKVSFARRLRNILGFTF